MFFVIVTVNHTPLRKIRYGFFFFVRLYAFVCSSAYGQWGERGGTVGHTVAIVPYRTAMNRRDWRRHRSSRSLSDTLIVFPFMSSALPFFFSLWNSIVFRYSANPIVRTPLVLPLDLSISLKARMGVDVTFLAEGDGKSSLLLSQPFLVMLLLSWRI